MDHFQVEVLRVSIFKYYLFFPATLAMIQLVAPLSTWVLEPTYDVAWPRNKSLLF